MIKICLQCNEKFNAKNKNVKYCCKKCYYESMKTTKIIKCLTCNKEFKQTYAKQKYCSKECSGKALENKNNILICPVCNKKFNKNKTKTKKYCSKKCYSKNTYLPIITKICKQCGKKFKTKRYDAMYCSRDCHYKHDTIIEEKHKVCPQCNKTFSEKYNDGIYCSQECYFDSIKKELKIYICKNCGKEILDKYSKRVFCSNECRDVWRKTDEGRKVQGLKMKGKISPKRGIKLSEETKKKISQGTKKGMKKTMENKGKNWHPFFNRKAAGYFSKFNEENNTNGQHALNGGEKRIYNEGNIFLDYINDDLKLIIEYDESHHKYQQEEDKAREIRIIEKLPEYKLIRIDDNKVNSFNDFKNQVDLFL